MAILIGLLTFILVLTALFLILLVLVQLPKKEAGVAMAFGAGMSEVLLGAGSGNVLTKITKYAVMMFIGLSLLLSVLISYRAREGGQGVVRALEEKARATAPVQAPAPRAPTTFEPLAATNPLATTLSSNAPVLVSPATNNSPPPAAVPTPAATNAPPAN